MVGQRRILDLAHESTLAQMEAAPAAWDDGSCRSVLPRLRGHARPIALAY